MRMACVIKRQISCTIAKAHIAAERTDHSRDGLDESIHMLSCVFGLNTKVSSQGMDTLAVQYPVCQLLGIVTCQIKVAGRNPLNHQPQIALLLSMRCTDSMCAQTSTS